MHDMKYINRPTVWRISILCLSGLFFLAAPVYAQEDANPEGFNILNRVQGATQPDQISSTLLVVFLITVLSLAPAILIMTTSFTRIIVVLGFLRQAMATQQAPPTQVLVGLALFLTFFIMMPTYQEVNEKALQPYIRGEFSPVTIEEDGRQRTITPQEQAMREALKPVRAFMFRQTNPKDVAMFIRLAKIERPANREGVPTHVLIPSFILSEMRTAFIFGFILYIPFLIIDMVVASTLMAMGMMMLPPIFVSLPFKIIMFILADGWSRLIESLARSYQ